jgi:hypothetical protein
MEVNHQPHAPAALPPDKDPTFPPGLEAGWTPELVWTLKMKCFVPVTN